MSDIEQRFERYRRKRQRYILAALILDYLNREKIRATYEAVADTIGAGEPVLSHRRSRSTSPHSVADRHGLSSRILKSPVAARPRTGTLTFISRTT